MVNHTEFKERTEAPLYKLSSQNSAGVITSASFAKPPNQSISC